MKKTRILFILTVLMALVAFKSEETKLLTKTGHIKFFSHTVAEDITANNYAVTSALDLATGDIVFSVPMQGFEFEKAAMQKHYNSSKFLDTKQFPKAKFKGNIKDISEISISKDGTYNVAVAGELTMHGVTKAINEKATMVIANGKVIVTAMFSITLADYKIGFKKGKPSTNIAKTIEITIKMDYLDS